MSKEPNSELEFLNGKINALVEVVMALARHSMTVEQFRSSALPALERLETRSLNTQASDQYLLGIQVLRGWLDEQSQRVSAPRTPQS